MLKVDVQDYLRTFLSFYNILRPQSCPICGVKAPLRKHGVYSRYFCDFFIGVQQIDILRYYCSSCGGTVSFLPTFALPHRQFSARIISICLQLVFACGVSLKATSESYPDISRPLLWNWIKSWCYNSNGIISVMRNYFGAQSQPAVLCDGHSSKWIIPGSLEAFFIVSDFVIGYEICSCGGACSEVTSSCGNRDCSGILEEIQKEFFKLPLSVELL